METKVVQCPTCKVGLEVKNTRDEAVKSIKCPNCQTPLKVIFRQPPAQQPPVRQPVDLGATVLPGMQGNKPQQPQPGGVTQLGPTRAADATKLKSELTPGWLVCNGREYPLQMGQNIVGRKNITKPTTIMLDVNDSYMSRMHICINVEQVGNSIRATISNYQNTNDTQVAGLPLRNGEVVVLSNGMDIKMGDTTVVYRSGTK